MAILSLSVGSSYPITCDFCCGVLSRAAPRGLWGGGTWFEVPLFPTPRADGPPAIVIVRAHPPDAGGAAREGPEAAPREPAAWGGRRGRAEPGVAEGGVRSRGQVALSGHEEPCLHRLFAVAEAGFVAAGPHRVWLGFATMRAVGAGGGAAKLRRM